MNKLRTNWEIPDENVILKEKVTGYPLIIGYLGIIMILSGIMTMLPLVTLIFYPQEIKEAGYFIAPGVISILAGYLFSLVLRGKEKGNLERNQEMIIVTGTWMIAIVVTAMPFVMTGHYSFTQAVFETTSGLSTTGLSVVDVSQTSHIFLIHRSVLLFFGGIGLVLVMTSVLSEVYGMRLYNAEGHADRLLPNLLESARLIIGIYSGYILGGMLLYVVFGMNLFDAINHSIAAVSTGGFSTRVESIGYYDSSAIEMVTIILMLLGGTNFFVHLLLLRGKFRDYVSHCETKMTLFFLAFFVPVMVVLMMGSMYNNISEGIRAALFQAVSALTTTGFQTVDSFKEWSSSLKLLMILLMLAGGSAGSTAGGLKVYRVYVLFKEIWWKFKGDISSKRFVLTEQISKYGKKETITQQEKNQVNTFAFCYMLVFLTGTFIFCLYGYSIEDSMFEFSSALSTVGLSAGITGYDASPVIHWTATTGMFLGRLELFAVLIAGARMFSDGKATVYRKKKLKRKRR